LIRRILDNSNHQFLKLEDIVETLKMYVELEAFRFNKEFTYEFNVDKTDERIYDVLLPPMLLQPFVENAILHGLMPKEGEKHLSAHFFIKNDALHCIIEDNGMGRREKTQSNHISRGEKLTRGMLESMKLVEKAAASIVYEDLKGSNNEPAGTRVIIKIPVEK
jgi:LytS/YehU family sensor histidine kinase